jgi:CRP/FNR family transcriptional regulator, cyclic AMP receptor protein
MRTPPVVSLLELDGELGELVPPARLEQARLASEVMVQTVRRGVWNLGEIAAPAPRHPGLLIIDGFLARDLMMPGNITTELLGPGDFLRPWSRHRGVATISRAAQWTVLEDAQVALLDQRFAVRTAAHPEVGTMLLDRLNRRVERLAVAQAIVGLNGVDRRILTLFWHLAELWGRVTPRGVVVPMTISHRMVAQLVGARRATVTTAITQLHHDGELERANDGTWLLTGQPLTVTDQASLGAVIPPRRRQFAPRRSAAPAPAGA